MSVTNSKRPEAIRVTKTVGGVPELINPATEDKQDALLTELQTQQKDALTDAELRASAIDVDDNASEFWRIKNKRYTDAEEVRYDIPTAIGLVNGDIYVGVAPDGTATSATTWTVIRTYFDGNGNPSRDRIRFNVAWDNRATGW